MPDFINAARFVTLDWQDPEGRETIDASLFAFAEVGIPDPGTFWLVERAWFRNEQQNPITARIFTRPLTDKLLWTSVMDVSPENNAGVALVTEDISDETNPIIIRDTGALVFGFYGGVNGDKIAWKIQYRIAQLQYYQVRKRLILPSVPANPQFAHQWPGSPS